MNRLQRRSEELQLTNRTQRNLNLELAKTNAAYKARMQKLHNEICSLHRANMNLIQEISTHHKKLPELEQHFVCVADIPPSQNVKLSSTSPASADTVQGKQRGPVPSTPARSKELKCSMSETAASSTPSDPKSSSSRSTSRSRRSGSLSNEPVAKELRVKKRKSYALPSLKSKLRKGDPFTFTN